MPWNEKIIFIIDYPFDFLRKITIPPCEDDKFNKYQCWIFPIPACVFTCYVAFRTFNIELLIICLVVGSILSLIFFLWIK